MTNTSESSGRGCQKPMGGAFRVYACGKPIRDGDRCGLHSEAARHHRVVRREAQHTRYRLRADAEARRLLVERSLHDFWCQVAIARLLEELGTTVLVEASHAD